MIIGRAAGGGGGGLVVVGVLADFSNFPIYNSVICIYWTAISLSAPLQYNNLTSPNLQFRPLNFIIGPQIFELVQNNHKKSKTNYLHLGPFISCGLLKC